MAADDALRCTAVILPWLRLGHDLTFGPYRFLVWPREDAAIPAESRESLAMICGIHKDMFGRPVEPQTIMMDSTKSPFARLTHEDVDTHVTAVILLTTALLGRNTYFQQLGGYCNATMAEPIFQNFVPGKKTFAIHTRRREGHMTNMGMHYDEVTTTMPQACMVCTERVDVSDDWLGAFATVLPQRTDQDRLILEACSLFNQANTDWPTILHALEVISLANAFDRLWGDCGGKKGLAEKVGQALASWCTALAEGSTRVGQAAQALDDWAMDYLTARERRRAQDPPVQAKMATLRGVCPLVRLWAWELYQLRNDYVHGNDISRRTWAWAPAEHLLLGAFIFPRLVKVLLAAAGRCDLTEEDHGELEAIDGLLDMMQYQDEGANLWGQYIAGKRIESRIRRSLERRLGRGADEAPMETDGPDGQDGPGAVGTPPRAGATEDEKAKSDEKQPEQ